MQIMSQQINYAPQMNMQSQIDCLYTKYNQYVYLKVQNTLGTLASHESERILYDATTRFKSFLSQHSDQWTLQKLNELLDGFYF